MPPSLGFEKTIGRGGETANLDMQDITRAARAGDGATAAGFRSNKKSDFVNKSPLVAESMQDYLKQQFIKEATEDGVVNPAKARRFIDVTNKEMVDAFPSLKKQLNAARKTEDVARRVTKETDAGRTRFEKPSVSKTANMLKGPLDERIKK